MENINKKGKLSSGIIVHNNNQNNIITSNSFYSGINELFKVFDFKGNKINKVKYSNNQTFFIDKYYDNNYNKNYIITGNKG